MGRRSRRFPGDRSRAPDLDEGFGPIDVVVAVAVAVAVAVEVGVAVLLAALLPTALILDDAAGQASTARLRLTALSPRGRDGFYAVGQRLLGGRPVR